MYLSKFEPVKEEARTLLSYMFLTWNPELAVLDGQGTECRRISLGQ